MYKFWPCLKNNKMTQDYDNNGYTVNIDYHDFIIKEYFSFKKYNKYDASNIDAIGQGDLNSEDELYLEFGWYRWSSSTHLWHYWKNGKGKYPTSFNFEESIKYIKENKKHYLLTLIGFEIKDVPQIIFSNEDESRPDYIKITINIKKYKNYPENFNFLKVNWFLSDFNQFNDKIEYSFWHVVNIKPIISKRTGEIEWVDYYLKLDQWSTLYNSTMSYNGVVNIKRMHNNRFRNDDILDSGYLIPDFVDNEYIRNCDDNCIKMQNKTQLDKSQILISNRNFKPEINEYKNTLDTKWDTSTTPPQKINTNIPFVVMIWSTSGEEISSSKQEWTSINNYAIPYLLHIFIPTSNENFLKEIKEAMEYIGSKSPGLDRRIQYANISEFVFEDKDFVSAGKPYLYKPQNNKINLVDETFILKDDNKIFINKLFFTPYQISASPFLDWRFEPHLYTNNHFHIEIALYNKQKIMLDISTIFFNNKGYTKNEFWEPTNSLSILIRRGFVSPDGINLTNILLNGDTSIASKRDSGQFLMPIAGDYSHSWWADSYLEFMRTNQNQKNAGINAIQKEAEIQQKGSWFDFGKSAGSGAIRGAAMSMSAGPIGAVVGAGLGAIGGMFSSSFGVGQTYYESKARAEYQMESLNAYYDDMKNMPANNNVGAPATTASDIAFSRKDDEDDKYGYKKIWTPTFTMLELKVYEKENIAYHINKYGYPQDRWKKINNLYELMIRKFWNQLQITNADEFYKRDEFPDFLYIDLLNAFSKKNGMRLHNLESLSYDNIYNYDLNNYENFIDTSIANLEMRLGSPGGGNWEKQPFKDYNFIDIDSLTQEFLESDNYLEAYYQASKKYPYEKGKGFYVGIASNIEKPIYLTLEEVSKSIKENKIEYVRIVLKKEVQENETIRH